MVMIKNKVFLQVYVAYKMKNQDLYISGFLSEHAVR